MYTTTVDKKGRTIYWKIVGDKKKRISQEAAAGLQYVGEYKKQKAPRKARAKLSFCSPKTAPLFDGSCGEGRLYQKTKSGLACCYKVKKMPKQTARKFGLVPRKEGQSTKALLKQLRKESGCTTMNPIPPCLAGLEERIRPKTGKSCCFKSKKSSGMSKEALYALRLENLAKGRAIRRANIEARKAQFIGEDLL